MDIFQHIKELLKDVEHPVVFEIGAHYCEDTIEIMNSAGYPEKQVDYFVFEPDPRNIQRARSKVANLRCVLLFCCAIGDKIGSTKFYLSSGNANGGEDWTGSSSVMTPKNHLNAHPWCKFEDQTEVPIFTLDHIYWLYRLPKIDFIWCDIQGAEGNMVKGGQEALKNTRYLYCEYSDAELYEGEMKLEEWMKLLPGRWSVIEKWPHDILLRNDDFNTTH